MTGKGMNKLLWIALGLHVLYFLCLMGFVIFQRQVIGLYTYHMDEIHVFPALFLIAGALAYLIIHIVLTVMLVKQPSGNGIPIFWEVMAAVVFGVAFPCINQFSRLIVQGLINRGGVSAIVSYSAFTHAAAWIAPVRLTAVSLLLLAAGMAIYGKLKDDGKGSFNDKKLVGLLWGSLGLDGVFFVIMMAVVLFQNPLKSVFGCPKIMFVFPGLPVAGYCIFLLIHLCLTVIMVNQLKRGSGLIICEILGMLIYCGILGWPGIYLDYINAYLLGRAGYMAVANFGAVTGLIYPLSPVHTIGINLFLLCCGMTMSRKFMRSHP